MPSQQGLYNPSYEKDSCGIGFIAHIDNASSHAIVQDGLRILCNVTHRGAVGADALASDGVGILTRMPHAFFSRILKQELIPDSYGVMTLTCAHAQQQGVRAHVEALLQRETLPLLAWRHVPTKTHVVGESLRQDIPCFIQAFIGRPEGRFKQSQDFDRTLYVIRKQLRHALKEKRTEDNDIDSASASSQTIVYKALVMASHLKTFFPDLMESDFTSSIALVHQRFSTNTFPSWSLAQPFRLLCHNGEINTLRGNINWMCAREQSLEGSLFTPQQQKALRPVITEGLSDSACVDEVLELMLHGGYSLPHAVTTLIPEAWQNDTLMAPAQRAFYAHHAAIMEPWDGPAAIAFTDGRLIGAVLDRNGLRPARYIITRQRQCILASEAGVLQHIHDHDILKKGRLHPGKMLLIDLHAKRIIDDDTIKTQLVNAHPWQKKQQQHAIPFPPSTEARDTDIRDTGIRDTGTHGIKTTQKTQGKNTPAIHPPPFISKRPKAHDIRHAHKTFGYTREDILYYIVPMMTQGKEPLGSMGVDTPPAVLSTHHKSLYHFFKQRFAQVTNPAIDPLREAWVMSLKTLIGAKYPLFEPQTQKTKDTTHPRYITLEAPCIDSDTLAQLCHHAQRHNIPYHAIDITFDKERSTLADTIDALNDHAYRLSTRHDTCVLVLTDRALSKKRVPIPSLLALSAVHHHLIKKGTRLSLSLLIDSGDAREPHHMACLAGYGADAICPWLALETIHALYQEHGTRYGITEQRAQEQYLKACHNALLKTMSKMGISTYQSYCGGQIFDSLGLSRTFIDRYFPATSAPISGVDGDAIEKNIRHHHDHAWNNKATKDISAPIPSLLSSLKVGGDYAMRTHGESHAWHTDSIASLQHAVRGKLHRRYKEFTQHVYRDDHAMVTLRRLLSPKILAHHAIPLSEVESASHIVQRFATGAMSFGSISYEAHTNLAIAMNRINGKSNTGEGGEDEQRYHRLENGDSMRSRIKQVASGRFGVNSTYLVNADDIQIKICQGAKPGEGGQLPGEKVDAVIARIRCSTPGVGLISPPPHHDIYSIEDIAQLIFDLKNINPQARISVKLASEVGVGVVAAGVAKARADHITIAGTEGGTGASPLASIKHTGLPWEIGLSETQQTLVLNRLRDRVCLQVDGGLRTGEDVLVATLLGADEFGFSTAPLIASGCLMMRKCHLNTCPVGIATQNPILRERFHGTPDHVINYFFFVADELRYWMSLLGYRTLQELIGRADILQRKTSDAIPDTIRPHADAIDLSPLLFVPPLARHDKRAHHKEQRHPLADVKDQTLVAKARQAFKENKPLHIDTDICNTDRTFATMLSGFVSRHQGTRDAPHPHPPITLHARGCAGQSFGAFLCKNIHLTLEGEGNDYLGKGLSGGHIVVHPHKDSQRQSHDNMIIGNTALYGATSGSCFVAGMAGERFAVRNSGAVAVVEGVGDHACEYMTGGCVAILGAFGRNAAAGMSGGIAYLYDADGTCAQWCNTDMVDIAYAQEWQKGKTEEKARRAINEERPDPQSIDRLMVSIMEHPLQDDWWRLRMLITLHAHYSKSRYAKSLLDDWEKHKRHFVKIIPRDFRHALTKDATGKKSLDCQPQTLVEEKTA
ncbi:MAG: glutamate synthase large subunit [Alphaproteobacteria bacterium GM7ARS4]|nr:glutamate synthase large subunit [Alphaproteobacteria bacterium GM7ARS4]